MAASWACCGYRTSSSFPGALGLGAWPAHSLRLDVVDSSGGNTGLVEFAAYGTPLADE